MRTGVSAHTQTMARYVRHYLSQHAIEEGTMPSVSTAARLFQMIAYQNKDFLQAAIICAGWDPVMGPQVYDITLGGSLIQEPYSISGSGSGFMYGYCDANWREDMTLQECKDFVAQSVSLAMTRDGSSGGIIRLCTVTPEQVVREYMPQENLPYKL